MVASGADPAVRLSARPYTAADRSAVLALVADDRLTCQPEATAVTPPGDRPPVLPQVGDRG